MSIRGVKELKYAIIDVTRVSRGGAAEVLEEIEDSRVLFEAFEGAVFIHQGLTYLVQEVSHEMRVARVTRADVNWTTSPRSVSGKWPATADSFAGISRAQLASFFHRKIILRPWPGMSMLCGLTESAKSRGPLIELIMGVCCPSSRRHCV